MSVFDRSSETERKIEQLESKSALRSKATPFQTFIEKTPTKRSSGSIFQADPPAMHAWIDCGPAVIWLTTSSLGAHGHKANPVVRTLRGLSPAKRAWIEIQAVAL
jgi:hypothetical protein